MSGQEQIWHLQPWQQIVCWQLHAALPHEHPGGGTIGPIKLAIDGLQVISLRMAEVKEAARTLAVITTPENRGFVSQRTDDNMVGLPGWNPGVIPAETSTVDTMRLSDFVHGFPFFFRLATNPSD